MFRISTVLLLELGEANEKKLKERSIRSTSRDASNPLVFR